MDKPPIPPWKFQPGNQAWKNRVGKSVSLVAAIQRKIQDINPSTNRQYVDDLAFALIQLALPRSMGGLTQSGNVKAQAEILNRVDGKQTGLDPEDKVSLLGVIMAAVQAAKEHDVIPKPVTPVIEGEKSNE